MKNYSVSSANKIDFFLVETSAAQSLDVQAVEFGSISGCIAERRHIFGNHGTCPDERARAHSDELVNADEAADNDEIFDDHMATQRRAIGNDIVVP